MSYIFDSTNLNQITAIVQNCEIRVIVGMVRKEMDLMQSIKEYNHILF